MHISFAWHTIEIQHWTTVKELLEFLDTCNSGRLLLGENVEQEVDFFSVVVNLKNIEYAELIQPQHNRFGLGICSQVLGLKPHLLPLPDLRLLVLGFNSETIFFSVSDLEVVSKISLGYSPFHSFLHVDHLGVILAFHEIGVVALLENGSEVWRYEKDIIVDFSVDANKLNLKFMDSPPITLDLLSGSR